MAKGNKPKRGRPPRRDTPPDSKAFQPVSVDLTSLPKYNEIEIALSDVLIEGDEVTFSYNISSSVYNQGGKDAGGFSIKYTAISNEVTKDLGTCDIDGLLINQGKFASCKGTITLALGEYELRQTIDCYNEVYEITESNNIHSNLNPLILSDDNIRPDLISNDIDISKSNIVLGNDWVTFNYEVSSEISNKGLVGTSEGFYIQYIAKSSESLYELGEAKSSESLYGLGEVKTSESIYILGEYYIESLAPNEKRPITCEGEITLPFGEYTIICSVDYNDNVIEVDDDNNIYNDSYPLIVSEDILLPDIMPYNDFEIVLSDIYVVDEDLIGFSYEITYYITIKSPICEKLFLNIYQFFFERYQHNQQRQMHFVRYFT